MGVLYLEAWRDIVPYIRQLVVLFAAYGGIRPILISEQCFLHCTSILFTILTDLMLTTFVRQVHGCQQGTR